LFYFSDNGHDGKESTLGNKKAKCTMFFAVHVTHDNKKAVYGMNFDKAGIKQTDGCVIPQNSVEVPHTIILLRIGTD
jgi:hypothetical protein